MTVDELNLDKDFLDQMTMMLQARIRLEKITAEDEKIIEEYLSHPTDVWSNAVQEPDEIEDENAEATWTPFYRLIRWLAHQQNVPGGVSALIRGMATVSEKKWSQSQAFSAWMSLRMKHKDYLDSSREYLKASLGMDWDSIPSPKLGEVQVNESGKQSVKEILCDTLSNGFIVHFRYLKKDEHRLVQSRIVRIPGRQFFTASKATQRMQGEPHWYIPGDSVSAGPLQSYIFEINQRIADKTDTKDYEQAAYWSRKMEQLPWKIGPGVLERIEYLMSRSKRLIAMSEAHAPTEDFKLHYTYKNLKGQEPRPFQVAGVQYLLECTRESYLSGGLHGNGAYIGDPMGLGKTLEAGIMTVLEAWEEKLEKTPGLDRNSLRCLILSPASLKNNWYREFVNWLDATCREAGFQIQLIRGGRAVPIWGNFVIVNPELLKKEHDRAAGDWIPQPLYMVILAERWFAVAADEGHYYKSWSSQRTSNALELFSGKKRDSRSRSLVRFRLPIPLRLMLSGSPVLNRAEEWSSQLEALGLLEPLGGMSRYIANYCASGTPPARLKELSIKLKERGYLRREKTDMAEDTAGKVIPLTSVPRDILDPMWVDYKDWPRILEQHNYRFLPGVLGQLPPKIRVVETLPMSKADRLMYMRAERDFIRWLKDHYKEYDDPDKRLAAAMRAMALVYITKLKHLAAKGKIKPAIAWIKRFMEETDDAKLVYYVHHRDIHTAIRSAFPDAAYIIGDQSQDERTAMIDRFQNDPNCRLIVCTEGSGGVGITLTAANFMAIMELPWGPAVMDQLEDRIWGRLNDLHGATIYLHLADFTIDTRIAAMIDRKRTVVTAVTTGSDAEENAYIRELMDEYYLLYGREDNTEIEALYQKSLDEAEDEESGEGAA